MVFVWGSRNVSAQSSIYISQSSPDKTAQNSKQTGSFWRWSMMFSKLCLAQYPRATQMLLLASLISMPMDFNLFVMMRIWRIRKSQRRMWSPSKTSVGNTIFPILKRNRMSILHETCTSAVTICVLFDQSITYKVDGQVRKCGDKMNKNKKNPLT